MNTLRIRRQFANYRLPSESKNLLQSICGQTITALKVGLRGRSAKAVSEGLAGPNTLSTEQNGDGGFLVLDGNKTVAFRFDEFLSSIVLREVDARLDSAGFLDHLYAEDDYVPWFLKIYLFADMPGSQSLIGKKITSVSVYKHPDNYRGWNHKFDQLHEIGIGLKLSDGHEYLITPGFGKERPAEVVSVHPINVLKGRGVEAPERIWESHSVESMT